MAITMTMIGCSGTGKSCYLYGTYARMLDGISDFHFTPTDYNQGIDLEEAWDSICEGHWPPGTDESTTVPYIFDCLYQGQSIGKFTWLDYRGGILRSKKSDDAPEDVKKFHDRCQNTNAFLVCIPADTLIKASLKIGDPPETL